MRYKVGDKVTVRKDLVLWEEYGCDSFVTGMEEFLGKEVTIDFIKEDSYRIEEGEYNWTEEMFEEPVECLTGSVEVQNVTVSEISADKIQCGQIQLPTKKKIKEGDKVIVLKSIKIDKVDTAGKEKMVGKVGIVSDYGKKMCISHNGILYEHSLVFFDEDAQRQNQEDNVWLFADEELQLVNRVLVNSENSDKIIINYPAIVYIANRDGKEFKGVALVMEGDAWDEMKGVEIAKTKAEIKVLQKKLKELSK